MSIQHKFDSAQKTLVITITGPFNFNLNAGFRDAYRDRKPGEVTKVSVNLRLTDYMDSSALGMLLLLDEHFESITINLENCPEYIKSVLEVANFQKKFNIS